MTRELRPSDGIDPAVHRVQPPTPQPVFDRIGRHSEIKQLRSRDHPMLLCREGQYGRQRDLLILGVYGSPKGSKTPIHPP